MLKVGIAGYGVVGKQRRICVERNPHLQLVAVCDRALPELAFSSDGIRQYRDYQHLLKEQLDVLIVCLTNDIAAEVTTAGLERGGAGGSAIVSAAIGTMRGDGRAILDETEGTVGCNGCNGCNGCTGFDGCNGRRL